LAAITSSTTATSAALSEIWRRPRRSTIEATDEPSSRVSGEDLLAFVPDSSPVAIRPTRSASSAAATRAAASASV